MPDLIGKYRGGPDWLDPALNTRIVESIHNGVMEALAAKGRVVYEMTSSDAKERLNKKLGHLDQPRLLLPPLSLCCLL
jgi:hypothetical protein